MTQSWHHQNVSYLWFFLRHHLLHILLLLNVHKERLTRTLGGRGTLLIFTFLHRRRGNRLLLDRSGGNRLLLDRSGGNSFLLDRSGGNSWLLERGGGNDWLLDVLLGWQQVLEKHLSKNYINMVCQSEYWLFLQYKKVRKANIFIVINRFNNKGSVHARWSYGTLF